MKIKELPSIKKALAKYNKLQNQLSSLQNMIEKENTNNNQKLQKEFHAKFCEIEEFIDEFAEIVFDELSKSKPTLMNIRTKTVSKWDDLFPHDKKETLSNKKNCRLLVGLITGVGLYRLN